MDGNSHSGMSPWGSRTDYLIRNFSLSFAAGNANVWKPSPSTPLCAIAVTKIIAKVLEKNGLPGALSALVSGGRDVGEAIVHRADIPLGRPLLIMVIFECSHTWQSHSPVARR